MLKKCWKFVFKKCIIDFLVSLHAYLFETWALKYLHAIKAFPLSIGAFLWVNSDESETGPAACLFFSLSLSLSDFIWTKFKKCNSTRAWHTFARARARISHVALRTHQEEIETACVRNSIECKEAIGTAVALRFNDGICIRWEQCKMKPEK